MRRHDLPTLFEAKAIELGIRHKLIRLYTPRHNMKAKRSHREDQKRFYSKAIFFLLPTSSSSLKSTDTVLTKYPCVRSVGNRKPNILHHTMSNMFDKPTIFCFY